MHGLRFAVVCGIAILVIRAQAQQTSGTAPATLETSITASDVQVTMPSPADIKTTDNVPQLAPTPGSGEGAAHQNRNPLAGLPASLAALRDYRSMRVSSADKKGNADALHIGPHQTKTVAELQGPGEITHLWTTIAAPDPNHLRNIVIRIYWDGNDYPSVESPIGDFYGLGHAMYYVFNNPVQAMGTDHGMSCFWPMPFAKSAKMTITNDSDKPVHAYYYYVDWRKFDTPQQNLGYFHAQYRQAFPNENGKPYLILDADGGRGHFCGVSLSIHTQVGGWWGEGDDLFTIDGEAEPSLWGTGSEDYFCGAWCFGQTFYTNYFGMPLRTKMNHDADNYWNVYRLHLESPVAFTKSLKVEIEHGAQGFDETREGHNNDYSSVAYWYQETPRPLKGKFAEPAERISLYQPPAPLQGVFEFQYMNRQDITGVQADAQQMGHFGGHGSKWHNGDQLWVRGLKPQQKLDLTFETTESLSGDAVLRVTRANDYGRASISLDGKKLSSYDGYSSTVATALIPLGKMQLPAGKHVITINMQGKNAAARNTHWGGDYLRIGGQIPDAEKDTPKINQPAPSGRRTR